MADADDAGSFWTARPGLFAEPDLAVALAPARAAATADTRLPIVLEGETGTGKERVARAIHLWSGRSGPFVAINAAAIPEAIAEAELSATARGRSAVRTGRAPVYSGRRAAAPVLIDEIVELPPAIQPKLLRCLENREVVPLGETTPVGGLHNKLGQRKQAEQALERSVALLTAGNPNSPTCSTDRWRCGQPARRRWLTAAHAALALAQALLEAPGAAPRGRDRGRIRGLAQEAVDGFQRASRSYAGDVQRARTFLARLERQVARPAARAAGPCTTPDRRRSWRLQPNARAIAR